MTKTSFVAALGLLSAVAAGSAIAQTGNATTNGTGNAATSGWMTHPTGNAWLASHLKGINVYNGQDQKLGSIDELIMDQQGKVQAAVLDVGGFLGMGVHRVAVPFDQLHFTDRGPNNTVTNNTPNGTVSRPLLNTNGSNAPGNPTATGPGTTGNALGSMPNGGNQAGSAVRADVTANTVGTAGNNNANNNVPNRATLNMTADQLRAAPEFRYNT